ncbi:MAG: hypothetical protein ACO4B4_03655 [Planctomycetota bacterium]
MLPRKLIATAVVPDSTGPRGQSDEISPGDELHLYQRGEDFQICVGNWELMTSRATSSEMQLAELACDRLAGNPAPHVLIGGLGMGFTLRATLDRLPEEARVTVCELVPEVVEWNRGVLASLAGEPLADPRVEVVVGDIARTLEASPRTFDAVITDIDNGPHSKTGPSEGWLYSKIGLRTLARAVRRPGVVTIWGAGPAKFFPTNLRAAGFEVEEIRTRSRDGKKGARFVIWVGVRRSQGGGESPPERQ